MTDLRQTKGETRLAPSHPEDLGLPIPYYGTSGRDAKAPE